MSEISMGPVERIVVAADAPRPYHTAALALSVDLGGVLEESEVPVPGALNLGPPSFARALAGVDHSLERQSAGDPWYLIAQPWPVGWVITGSSGLMGAHAALLLLDALRGDLPYDVQAGEVIIPTFQALDVEFDDWSAGFNRLADGFDMGRHVRDLVRVGVTSIDVNLLADAVPVQVRERRCPDDKYPWWCIYSAALDMFVESSLNRGTYDDRLLSRNLDRLKATYELALSWGLTPTVQVFEPRVVPERFFDKYPDLRGARVDCSDYSGEAEYALDPCHRLVREHYRELMQALLQEAPEIGRVSVWSQDSCAGFPWARQLYAGPNGPRLARKRPVQDSVTALMTALLEGGRSVNPSFEADICLAWFRDEGDTEPDEITDILEVLPRDVGVSFTIPLASRKEACCDGRLNSSRAQKIRTFQREPRIQIEGPSNWWKPLGPVHGVPHPLLTYDMLCSLQADAQGQEVILRGGVQTEVFVPHYINNEVIRAFQRQGSGFDIMALLKACATAWTPSPEAGAALLAAWRLCDEAVRYVRPLSWTVNFVSGRTLWRRLVKPLVPNQALLTWEDWRHYRHLEFTVGSTDPAWIDHFYKGWGRMVRDDQARHSLKRFDEQILPRLIQAEAVLDELPARDGRVRDVRDRIRCFRHMLTTDRHLIEVQEAIHACLAEDRETPERSRHYNRLRQAIDAEIVNTERFVQLLESSEARLIPVTSGVETPFMHKAPFAHQLRCKLAAMRRHREDPPGPWFEELMQSGGWTSDLREAQNDNETHSS